MTRPSPYTNLLSVSAAQWRRILAEYQRGKPTLGTAVVVARSEMEPCR